MVDIAQLVRAPDCGSGGREFESPMGHQIIYSKILRSSRTHDGEVSEWFKELVLKTSDA